MDDKDRLISELVDHRIRIVALCDCTKVTVMWPESALSRIGPHATLRIMEARLRCRHCRERPRLFVQLEWAISEGRDQRKNPPPIPDWARRLMNGA